ncbi:MAG: thioredoxin family protein [Bacteroidales bacterium]|nr:thioredoxin family protein [Bacteroidales bacterium]
MKKFLKLFTFFVLLLPFVAKAQMFEPVQWTVETEKLSKHEYNIVFKAEVEDGWHLYSQHTPFGGPMPLYFEFIDTLGIERIGGVVEPKAIVKYSDIFEIDEHYFENQAVFTQKVKLLGDAATVSGVITGQACEQQCVPITFDFEVQLGESVEKTTTNGETSGSKGGLLGMLLGAVIWGLAALMTPCVFPMIPMTVSFFLHGDESKAAGRFKAIMYYVFIVVLYTLPIAALILIARFGGGEDTTASIFNWISTSWINILFFVIFMVFAASFFGAFELTLPSSWVNKADSKTTSSKGLGGVFFMALVLVLVSFACTGPIVGTALIQSLSGEFWAPILTMLVFAMTFGLPFALCALFPSLLQNMPKSGGWLNSVKVVLGFIEIALGFKFLSVADQTYHWGLLDREVYLAIWIVVFTLLGLYLLGKIKFAHDSDVQHLSVFRLVLCIIVFTFVVYMIPGMWGAPLKALSGYLPPQQTMDFDLNRINQENSDKVIQYVDAKMANAAVRADQIEKNVTSAVLCEEPKYADFLHLPHGLKGYFDYEQGLECAKAQNKPIYIDFTGHGCVNCREMEANVWSDPRVLEMLRDEYVIIALYVDDKTTLPEDEWMVNSKGKKKKTSIGSKNSAFQISKFEANAQPYYCLMGHNGEVLVEPRSYNLDKDAFVEFLKKGVENFNKGVSIRNIYE